MVILDTNIIIEHLRLKSNKNSTFVIFADTHPKESLALSVISIQELYEGKSTKGKQEEQFLLATISPNEHSALLI